MFNLETDELLVVAESSPLDGAGEFTQRVQQWVSHKEDEGLAAWYALVRSSLLQLKGERTLIDIAPDGEPWA